ncbi:hypothetical protein PDESU_01382 [Pontiella desulfatans]|uniref:Uncharacterized protein n=1 Tax=Pontiella desulfatans TaxID=2750659 RepID=A0A6C2TYM0_PONDE|nr:type II toxin-antitoxin system HipA family toxin [Pontiella desulfatans]VGO12828.1 hypothetical protein PDESU_01382 [Pontiella desulfatans]
MHIIKPEPAHFPGLAVNEPFCMRLAKAVGLDSNTEVLCCPYRAKNSWPANPMALP